jgi:cytochrome c biogenesis protein CcmG/thiol:disulfide interchange protein DsbE
MNTHSHKIIALLLFPLIIAFSQISYGQNTGSKGNSNAGKPWLGIAIDKGKNGVLVKGVMANTPAEGAGIATDDEVVAIDGKSVREPRELIGIIQSSGIGQIVSVEILRSGKKIVKKLKLVLRPDEIQVLRDRLIGKPAPGFNLEVISGKESGDSKKITGKVAIVEFWATWCPACRATHPRLSEFAAANPNIPVLTISDEDKSKLESYAKKIKPKFTILRDAEGKSPAEWGAAAIPMISVIGKDGKIAFVTVGAGEDAEEALSLAVKLDTTRN